jgi:TolB-like protein
MNKKLIFILLLSASTKIFSQQYTIDEATKTAAREINQNNKVGSTLAVVSIKSLSDNLTSHIISLMETGLINTEKLKIVSRQKIQTVLNEQNFGMSGDVDDISAQKIGKILGASYVLTGDLVKPENKYYLNIQVLETETARIVYSRSFEIRNNELRNYEQLITLKQRHEPLKTKLLTQEEERYPIYFEIAYNYELDMPLGFSIGTFGLYTTWNFLLPNLLGYENSGWNNYDGDGKSTWSPGDYHDRGNRTNEGFEWVVGYKINLLTSILLLPIGVGANYNNELRLFDHIYSFSPGKIQGTEWLGQVNWTTKFIFEIGLEMIFREFVTIGSTYRLKNFKESSFTINAGVVFFDK